MIIDVDVSYAFYEEVGYCKKVSDDRKKGRWTDDVTFPVMECHGVPVSMVTLFSISRHAKVLTLISLEFQLMVAGRSSILIAHEV